MTGNKNNPIGVFDSGIGGLTVLREIARSLPLEETVYLGDTARVPYGTKSGETVIRYALEDEGFLKRFKVKLIVAACNTASAYALAELKKNSGVPVTGVIEPGARAALLATKTKRIGVIGTEGTVRSGAYGRAIKAVDASAVVFERACPLFVPLAEEGLVTGPIAGLIAERYLGPLKEEGIDTLVLGCTHYPLLKETIGKVMGPETTLIDSARATAEEVARILDEKGLARKSPSPGPARRFFVTDSPERFRKVGRRFFGEELDGVQSAGLEGL